MLTILQRWRFIASSGRNFSSLIHSRAEATTEYRMFSTRLGLTARDAISGISCTPFSRYRTLITKVFKVAPNPEFCQRASKMGESFFSLLFFFFFFFVSLAARNLFPSNEWIVCHSWHVSIVSIQLMIQWFFKIIFGIDKKLSMLCIVMFSEEKR